ncbi:MAG TPA: hypothetical protein PLU94_03985 [Methanoregulaceae archaeon]|nr:hypothetical protein [Methanoregulaceae archaeon]
MNARDRIYCRVPVVPEVYDEGGEMNARNRIYCRVPVVPEVYDQGW